MTRKILIAIFILLIGKSELYSQPIKPVAQKVGKTTIMADPRIELLNAVQVVADYTAINKNSPYSKELIRFFEKDSTTEAVKLTSQLANDFGFTFDAPLDLILSLTTVPELAKTKPFTQRTIERAGSDANLEKYRKALQQFAIESHFTDFWNSHIPFYQKMIEYTATELNDYDPSQTFEKYYNESKKSYNVILSPALGGGYGLRLTDENNEMDIYGCLNTVNEKDGIPYYSKDGLLNFLYHEFSHSYVNPLTDKYPEIVDATSVLFDPIKETMTSIHYGRWIICINEHIVRAAHIRILQSLGEEEDAQTLIDAEKERRFVYIEPVLNKLKQFEQKRDNENITFTAFYSELLSVFDSLSHCDNTNLINPVFAGPVQSVIGKKKLAIIYPTNSNDTDALQSLFDYTSRIQQMKGENAVLYADTTALKTNLSNVSIMAYGTIESNLFLKKYENTFPFRILGDTILTDKKFVGENLRLITCLPNPQNNHLGMLINTATRNQSLKGVSLPKRADYLVFEDIENLLESGYYNKDKSWSF